MEHYRLKFHDISKKGKTNFDANKFLIETDHMWLWYHCTNEVDMCDTIFEKGKKTNPTRKVINFFFLFQ